MSPTWRLIPPGLALIAVTYGFARFAYGLFLPAIRADVALGPTLAGLVAGGSYVGYCLAIVASTLLTERVGPRATAALAGTVAAAGMAAIAHATSPLVLAFAVLFAGLSTGLASPPLAQAVAVRVPSARQGRANTLINSGTCLGVVLSGPVAYAEAWREAYLLFAALAGGVTVWVWLMLPGGPRRTSETRADPILRSVRRPAARPLMLAACATGASSAIFWTFAGDAMVEAGGLPAATPGAAWIVLGLGGFVGAAAGDLVRRFGVSRVHRAALAALASATAVLGLVQGSLATAYLAAALFGAAYIMVTGVYIVWGVRVFADRPAVGLGLPFLLLALGQAAGAPLAGASIDGFGYPVAFALFAALALAAAALRPTDAAEPDAPRSADSRRS